MLIPVDSMIVYTYYVSKTPIVALQVFYQPALYLSSRIHLARAPQRDTALTHCHAKHSTVMLSAAKHLVAPTPQTLRFAQGDNSEAPRLTI